MPAAVRAAPSAMAKRACDSCRRRKIKCDSAPDECSNCRISNLTCSYTQPPRKRGPKPDSVRRSRAHQPAPTSSSESSLTSTSPIDGSILSPPQETQGGPLQPQGPPRGDWHYLVGISPDAASPSISGLSHGSEALSGPSWRPDAAIGIGTWPNSAIPDARDAATNIHNRLIGVIRAAVPSRSPRDIIDDCVTLFFRFVFPIAPMCHEPTMRHDVIRFFPSSAMDMPSPGFPHTASPFALDQDPKSHLASLRGFTRLIGLCGNVGTFMPAIMNPLPGDIAKALVKASRACFDLYSDYDVEHPNSSSVNILSSHSAAMHNSGHVGQSWHLLGRALLLTQEMGLHHERSLARYEEDPLEAQLLRHAFWVMHISNRSAAVLNNRPILLRESLLDPPSDVVFLTSARVPLLDPTRPYNAPPYEERILVGTDLCRRLWAAAADLVTGIQDCAYQQRQHDSHNMHSRGPSIADLMRSYVLFAGIIDDLPPWLQAPDSIGADGKLDAATAEFQRGSFWRLKVDVVVTFHCLRMVLLRRCAEHGLVMVMGLSEEPLMLEMRTAEIARDCLDAVDAIPFEYLQVNGEALMEKFRQIGSALLQLDQNTEHEMIRDRAKAYLARLLNILARLDSRAVDALNFEQT